MTPKVQEGSGALGGGHGHTGYGILLPELHRSLLHLRRRTGIRIHTTAHDLGELLGVEWVGRHPHRALETTILPVTRV